MNNFLMQGVAQYRDQSSREQQFNGWARRIRSLLQGSRSTTDDSYLLMLTPMIEVAWVDGRIGRPEQNAILKTAESYGLLQDDHNFIEIMERLSTRPHPAKIEHWWDGVAGLLSGLPPGQTAAISSLMLGQTRFVAELSQKQIFGMWRGHSCGVDEQDKLEETEQRFSRLRATQPGAASAGKENGIDDHLKLLPLVKVAWADGRITKREREMIFDSLFDLGIDPNNDNLNQLLGWLQLSPKDEFFQESLQKLRAGLETLSDDEHAEQKYSVISKCSMVAGVSGGDSTSPSGGPRICDEEITAVKQIARILNGAIGRN